MLAQVEKKIHELNKQQIQEYYKKRESDLISWGLVGKGSKDDKETPLPVSDDDYESLVLAASTVGRAGRNPVAHVLNVAATCMVFFGIIFGFVFLQTTSNLSIAYASMVVVASLAVGLIFRGISEAIKLLQQIVDRVGIYKPTAATMQHAPSMSSNSVEAVPVPKVTSRRPRTDEFPDQPDFRL